MTGRLLLLVVLSLLCLTTFADVAADEIHSLPGWDGPLPSRQWSGYLTFNKSKHMHYWLVESENDPANDPLVVWLNGGPGCSSLDGFIYEHGPFRLDSTNKKLVKWEYSWAKLANMIYLESPVGVGFSYSDNPNDYNTNDNKSSQDNLHAIETFFESFPRFKSHKFFIAGESYGGVYVPTFAEAIMWAINNGTYKGARPLGIAVGNGCSGNDIGVCGNDRTKYDMLYFLRSSLMSDTMKKDITNACGNFDNISPTCQNLVNTFSNAISDIDVYNIYGDCINGDGQRMPFGNNTVTKIPRKNSGVGAPGPAWCINSFAASDYFNQPEVQAAIHVKKPPYYWSVCANQINYDQNRANLPRDTYPALNKFLRVVVYNGDWDACVPYTDGEAWTKGMGYPAIKTWQPWYFTDNSLPGASNKQQVGGFSTVYQTPYHFSFITVKGGRHEVPETAPRQAFEMIRRLLTGEEF